MNLIPCKYFTPDYFGDDLNFARAKEGHLIMFFQDPDNTLQALVADHQGVLIYTHPTLIKIEGMGLKQLKNTLVGELSKLTEYVSARDKEFFINDIKTIINNV